jgi:ABC-type uncharacterized transport system permease subunit
MAVFDLTDRNFFLIAVAIYGVSTLYSVFLWRKGFQRDDLSNYGILLSGFAFHLTAMIQRGISFQQCPVTNLYEATVFIMWALAGSYLVVGLVPRLRFLGVFAAPLLLILGVFGLMPSLDDPEARLQLSKGMASLHAALSLLSYGAFGLAAATSAMFLSQQHDLKFNKLRAVLARLPPIQRLGTIVTRLLLAGFILLTFGLVAGWVYLARSDVELKGPDPKIPWSILVWALYLGLLVLRWKVDRGGRRVAWGSIVAFVFVMLTFWGTTLLSPLHTR